MAKLLKYTFLLVVFVISKMVTAGYCVYQSTDDSCKIVYEKLLKLSEQEAKGFYQKFTNQTFLGTTPGLKTTTEVWLDGENGIFENEIVTIFNKGNQQMLIMHSLKKIIIKEAEKEQQTTMGMPTEYSSYDTIIKYGNIKCSLNDNFYTMVINFPKNVAGNKNTIKRITYQIKQKTFELKKAKLDYYGEDEQIEVYDYLIQSSNSKKKDLTETFEQFIYDSNKRLKNEFEGYIVQDIRNKNIKK